MASKETNRDLVLNCINKHSEGLDDDQLSELSGVSPRQQVYQIATRLAADGVITRRSVVKPGKRRKIHNFPLESSVARPGSATGKQPGSSSPWRRRLGALVAATGKAEDVILDEALRRYAEELLRTGMD